MLSYSMSDSIGKTLCLRDVFILYFGFYLLLRRSEILEL